MKLHDSLLTEFLAAPPNESRLSRAEISVISLGTGGLLTVWLCLIAAEFGFFSNVWVAVAVISGLVATGSLAWRYWPRGGEDSGSRLAPAVALFLLAIGLFQVYPPSEHIVGGSDPGAYLAGAAQLARSEGLIYVDELLAMGNDSVTSFWQDEYSRLSGAYIVDLAAGTVVSHGLHLYTVALALAYKVGSFPGALALNTALFLFATLTFFAFVRGLLGLGAATLASLLLVSNVAFTWFAREPAAELLVMLLFLLAATSMRHSRLRNDALLGAAAGFLLGAMHLTKIENVTVPAAVALLCLVWLLLGRFGRSDLSFLGAYLLTSVHAVLHGRFVSTLYSETHFEALIASPLRRVLNSSSLMLIVVAGLALLLVVLLTLWLKRRQLRELVRREDVLCRGWQLAGLLLAIVVVAAYVLRPELPGELPPLYGLTDAESANLINSSGLTVLGWYASPLVVLLGLAGAVAFVAKGMPAAAALFFLVVLSESMVFLSNSRISPVQFWAARRFLAIIAPGLCLFAAYAIWQCVAWPRVSRTTNVVAAMLALFAILIPFRYGDAYRGHVDFAGTPAQLEALVGSLPENSVILFDGKHSPDTLAGPATYLYGVPSVALNGERRTAAATGELIHGLLAEGRRVVWALARVEALPQGAGEYQTSVLIPPDFAAWKLNDSSVGSASFSTPMVLSSVDRRPYYIVRLNYTFELFELSEKVN